jgi:adenylate cyclase
MSDRRLAAIMFTDIAGFTAITQSNESRALELLERHNKLLRPLLTEFGGKEIKTIGDSFLVEFESALNAVSCAVAIQKSLHDYNATSSGDDSNINIRIGIHLGDVVLKQGDVFGDAVNIASRIQPLADVGGICVSGQVYYQVQNKIDRPLERLERVVELKNVKFPVDVYKVILPWDEADGDSRLPSNKLRIAVLPFVNMSSSHDDEYFADGLTEELIAELAGVEGLSVISRTSVMHYKNSNKKILEIGKELRVGTVLEGSVRKAGNKIRITAQLIDSTSEDHLWADRYDREMSDIFAVQDEIAKSVTGALRTRLIKEPKVPDSRHTSDMVAYNLYLQGRYFWNKRSKEGVKKALELFEKVVERDPAFAQAYSGIADCYSIMEDRGEMTFDKAFAKSNEAAIKATQLDPNLAEAHTSLALSLLRNYEWERAEAEFKKAIALNPSYASAHQWYSHLLFDLGKLEEGAVEIKKAGEADPLSPVILQNLGFYYDVVGDYNRSLECLNRALEIQPMPLLYYTRAHAYADNGDKESALIDLERFATMDDSPLSKPMVAYAYAHFGIPDKAKRILDETLELSKSTSISAGAIAFVYGVLGDNDKCFEWLFRAVDERTLLLRIWLHNPDYVNVRRDPRFRDILRRCRVPESVVTKFAG